MKLIAQILAYTLFYIGDIVSKIMNFNDKLFILYPIYNWCMVSSFKLSEKYNLGIWIEDDS